MIWTSCLPIPPILTRGESQFMCPFASAPTPAHGMGRWRDFANLFVVLSPSPPFPYLMAYRQTGSPHSAQGLPTDELPRVSVTSCLFYLSTQPIRKADNLGSRTMYTGSDTRPMQLFHLPTCFPQVAASPFE